MMRPPRWPPSGPRSITQSAVLITSRLCSITTIVLPSSRSLCSTAAGARCRRNAGRWSVRRGCRACARCRGARVPAASFHALRLAAGQRGRAWPEGDGQAHVHQRLAVCARSHGTGWKSPARPRRSFPAHRGCCGPLRTGFPASRGCSRPVRRRRRARRRRQEVHLDLDHAVALAGLAAAAPHVEAEASGVAARCASHLGEQFADRREQARV